MATWKVARSSKVCALTGRPLEPGASVMTALFGVEEEVSDDKVRGAGFVRKDFLVDEAEPAALAAAVADAYCVWRTKLPPDTGPRIPRLDVAMARDLLERIVLENDPGRAAAAWTLEVPREHGVAEKDGILVLRWPKMETTFEVASVVVPDDEMERLEQDLSRLFEV